MNIADISFLINQTVNLRRYLRTAQTSRQIVGTTSVQIQYYRYDGMVRWV